MKNNIIEVTLWGNTVGLLSWDEARACAVFQFNAHFVQSGLNISPLAAPINSPLVQRGFPITGNKDKPYCGLPEFIADSLPDHWGNVVFAKWLEANNLQQHHITPVDRLSFIGKRAMGALEFHPAHIIEDASVDIKLESLYDLANKIQNERQDISINATNNLILEDLYKVGTSAGGQRPKAIIAIDDACGTIRSGQAELPPSYKHYILKFDTGKPDEFPFTRVEMAYWLMARGAGIMMMPSRLIEINGKQNFLTQRFDRVDGKKIHTQTLAAICADADSYEDLFVVGRRIGLNADEQSQQFRRMVFNVMAENVDDHTKNFSFLMTPDGKWHLSPAYDMIFAVDPATRFFRNHELSISGKRKGITRRDLLDFAARQDIKNPGAIIKEVSEAVSAFPYYADKTGIMKGWKERINAILKENPLAKGK